MRHLLLCATVAAAAFAWASLPLQPAHAHKVDFGPDGTCRVGGKPFFPIGIWIYGLDADVMADLREHRFNTVVGNSVQPAHVPMLERDGMMCIPEPSDAWLKVGKASPSLLAWYLIDEPEGRGSKPEDVRKMYDELKA